jgi:hypothetical protein
VRAACRQFHALQQVTGNDGQQGVELNVAGLIRYRDSGVISRHLAADHRPRPRRFTKTVQDVTLAAVISCFVHAGFPLYFHQTRLSATACQGAGNVRPPFHVRRGRFLHALRLSP